MNIAAGVRLPPSPAALAGEAGGGVCVLVSVDKSITFMNNNDDRNYISIGSWMFMMFITAIPIVGLIMILVWAFTGDNESRKNYYKAIIMWFLILVVLIVGIALLGASPAILKLIHQSTSHRP